VSSVIQPSTNPFFERTAQKASASPFAATCGTPKKVEKLF